MISAQAANLVRGFGILTLTALAFAASPAAYAAERFTAEQKQEIKEIIKEFIQENPTLIVDSYRAYQEKEQAAMEEGAQKRISENYDRYAGKEFPSAGNPEGDVTVIEFFDYHCGYCKKAYEDIQTILKSDKNVRFVFRELPILSPASQTAAEWSLAAHKQGKYFEFHAALMNHQGMIDESLLEKTGKDLGLDVGKLKQDAGSEEIKQAVANDRSTAQEIGIMGTPGFIINGKLKRGYLGEEGLKSAIAEARKNKNG
ncbi:MAG: thioredoxin domain-containing protein [Alphaproteobacteria bacterium]|nr:thioredoxin domain-containing protein [Alphaproteobacteria bacterium]